MSRAWAGVGFTALMTAALALLVFESFELGPISGWAPRRVIPLALVLVGFQLVRDIAAARAGGPKPRTEGDSEWTRQRAALGWALCAFSAVWVLGFQRGAPWFVAWFLRARARVTWPATLVSAAVVALLLFGLSFATEFRLYRGWLDRWL